MECRGFREVSYFMAHHCSHEHNYITCIIYVCTVHTKICTRMCEKMNIYFFHIIYNYVAVCVCLWDNIYSRCTKNVYKYIYYILYKCTFVFFSLSLSLSLSHTHTLYFIIIIQVLCCAFFSLDIRSSLGL
jgi:hypothetical protein